MSEVAVAGGIADYYNGEETTFDMRFEPTATFWESGGAAVLGGSGAKPDDYQTVPCEVVDNEIRYDTFSLYATQNAQANPRRAAYKVVLYNGSNGKFYKTLYNRLLVPEEPEETTLGALAAYSSPPPIPASLLDTILAYILSLFNSIGLATEINYGLARANTAPADPGDPVFIGPNDPILVSLGEGEPETPIFRSEEATFDAAAAAAVNKELSFNILDTLTATKTLSRFVKTSVRGDGGWSVGVGHGLTVQNLLDPGERKLNHGEGSLTITNSPHIRQSWWTGPFGGTSFLTANLNSTDLTFTVYDSSVFGPVGGYVCIDREFMKVTVNNTGTNQITVAARGGDSTAAATHIATTTLAEAIDISEDVWTLTNAAALGNFPYYLQCDSEIVKVTGTIGDDAYVLRAQGGTLAATHSNGATVHKRPEVLPAISSGMKTGIMASLTAAGGCTLIQSPGRWATRGGWNLPSGTVISGNGGTVDAGGGSVWQLVADSTYLFKIGDGKSAIAFKDVTTSLLGTTGSEHVRISGTGGSFCTNVTFDLCRFNYGDYGLNVYDEGGIGLFMALNIKMNQCHFITQELACYRLNTNNGHIYADQCNFTPRPNGVSGVHDQVTGFPFVHIGCAYNGVNVSPNLKEATITGIDTTTNIITCSGGHGLTVGETVKCSIYNATPANLPHGTININRTTDAADIIAAADMEMREFTCMPLSSTTAVIYAHPRWAWQGTPSDFYFNFTNAGSGTNVLKANAATGNSGRPVYCFRLAGTITGGLVMGCQDEGMDYWAIFKDTFQKNHPTTFKGNQIQSLIRFESEHTLVSEDNWMPANCFTEKRTSGNAPDAIVISKNDAIRYDFDIGGYIDLGATEKDPLTMTLDGFTGYSILKTEDVAETYLNKSNVPHLFTMPHQIDGLYTPAVGISRDRNINPTALLRLGMKESWEPDFSPNRYYDVGFLDHLPGFLVPTYLWMTNWLELLPNADIVGTAEAGIFLNSNIAYRGRSVNVDSNILTPTTGAVTINLSLGECYYFVSLTGDVQISVDVTAGHEGVPHERKDIYIPATTTPRVVTWSGGCFATGNKSFSTGVKAGMWRVRCTVFGGNNLMVGEPELMTSDGMAPNILGPQTIFATGTPEPIICGRKYFSNSAGQRRLLLPATAQPSDWFEVQVSGGGSYKIEQNAGQVAQLNYIGGVAVAGVNETTTGTGGYLESTDVRDSVRYVCIAANDYWQIIPLQGVVSLT